MVEYYTQLMQVFLSHLWEYDQIIQIDQAVDDVQLTHTILHKPLESSWGITKSITLEEP